MKELRKGRKELGDDGILRGPRYDIRDGDHDGFLRVARNIVNTELFGRLKPNPQAIQPSTEIRATFKELTMDEVLAGNPVAWLKERGWRMVKGGKWKSPYLKEYIYRYTLQAAVRIEVSLENKRSQSS